MSITSDIRAYADSALEQGRTQVTNVVSQAQSQFSGVTGDVSQRVSVLGTRATAAVGDLREQAEKVLNLDAIKSAVEPYLLQAKEYRTAVTDRASDLVGTVTADKRVAKVIDTAETLSGTVVGTVQQRVVKPVQSLTGLGKPASKPSAPKASATKPASTRPAPKPAAKATSAARKSTAKATAKAPAKKAPASN